MLLIKMQLCNKLYSNEHAHFSNIFEIYRKYKIIAKLKELKLLVKNIFL